MLESFWSYCDPNWDIDLYLVNDNSQYLDQLQPYFQSFRNTVITDNPLTRKSDHVMERMTAGTLHALNLMEPKCREYDYILKLDDDALVIGEFHQRLKDFFVDHINAGMIGSQTHFPDGLERPGNESWAPVVEKAISGKFIFPELRRYLRGHRPNAKVNHAVTRFLIGRSATRHKYTPGMHVQGGSYAISAKAVARVVRRLGDPQIFNYTDIGEDVALSLLVKSVGLELYNYNQSDEVFGVWWRTPTLSPAELVNRNYAIVHSIKYEDSQEEETIREYFRQRRRCLDQN